MGDYGFTRMGRSRGARLDGGFALVGGRQGQVGGGSGGGGFNRREAIGGRDSGGRQAGPTSCWWDLLLVHKVCACAVEGQIIPRWIAG